MRRSVLCIGALVLAACGGEQPKPGASSDGAVKTAKQSSSHVLTATPISFADATGATAKTIEVGPCPFVSDKAIKASVRTSFEITRREVSNTDCRWAYNAGFVIDVTIEDKASAIPIARRGYNIGVDTIIEPQDGPGRNAALLNDTAFDRPIPFAYSFEKDEKLVFIKYTGFKTDLVKMRAAADEIAAKMGAAPRIERQRRAITEPFKPCDVWSNKDLKTVFKVGDTGSIAPGARGQHTCSWTIYEDGVPGTRTASLNIYKTKAGQKAEYEYDSYKAFTKNGETHYRYVAPSDFGTYVHIITPRPEGLVYVKVSDPNADPGAFAMRLQENLLSRMTP